MAGPFDPQKMYKLPKEHRFFDINDWWVLPNQWLVRGLYPLSVTPNQVTFVSLILGVMAAVFYLKETPASQVVGGIFLYGKIFLDNVDGNLARSRGEVSRSGRFFDSLTDFFVAVLVYGAITCRLVRETGDSFFFWALGLLAMLSCLVHCSYFVFYLVQYTTAVGTYKQNRVNEEVTEEDLAAHAQGDVSSLVLGLQRLHHWAYGWQDRLIEKLDRFSHKVVELGHAPEERRDWYMDKGFISWISPLCLCTNNMALVMFSLLDRLDLCLLLIVGLGNFYLLGMMILKTSRYHSFREAKRNNASSREKL